MTKTVAFIQARMSSTRFPGKVLADLCGKPMIQFMIDRVKRAKRIDEVVLVTSTDASDDPVAELMARIGTPCFRGSLDDVLGRFHGASLAYPADVYVRLTGDCPLIDPAIIDDVIALLLADKLDYSCNTMPPTFPDGLDVEVFTNSILVEASSAATTTPQREHVTMWMYDSVIGLQCGNLAGLVDASHLRVTVDYPDDLEVVRKVLNATDDVETCDLFDILRIMSKDPGIKRLNLHARNEALANDHAEND
jgi:spore coat polysaccharide biosynthesis protein SpsF